MVKYPVPKREIVFSQVWKDSDKTQQIKTFSEDARQWIVQEAPKFGTLEANRILALLARVTEQAYDENPMTCESLHFCIDERYDVADVVEYLIEGYAEKGKTTE